jgi:MFS family permease
MLTATRRYRALFVAPGVPRVFAASLTGRLPIGMAMLLFVLVVHAGTGSYAIGGLAAAANSAATALLGPPMGRLADRGHAARVLVLTGLAQGAALVALVIVLHAHLSGPIVIVIAAIAGMVNPPIAAVTRTVLPRLAPDAQTRRTAFALDAMLVEITYVVGPALVGAVSAILDGYAATLLAAAFTVIGALWLAAAPSVRHEYALVSLRSAVAPNRADPTGIALPPAGIAVVPAGIAGVATAETGPDANGDGSAPSGPQQTPPPSTSPWRRILGPLVSGGLRVVLVVSVLEAAAFGVLEVAIPAYMNGRGQAAIAGLIFSVWSAGSIVGGLWFGGRDFRAPLSRQYAILMALNVVGFSGILLAGGPATLAPLLFLAGLVISPTTAVEAALVNELTPRHQTTEAFTWSGTAIYLGFGLGSALASVVMSSSLGSGGALTTAALLAVGLSATGTVLTFAGRRSLTRRPYAEPSHPAVHAAVSSHH